MRDYELLLMDSPIPVQFLTLFHHFDVLSHNFTFIAHNSDFISYNLSFYTSS